MKLSIKTASLLIVIAIFGFSSAVLAQTNKKTATKAQASVEAEANKTKTTKPKNDGIKQTTNVNISKSSNRPASTGTGNASTRPASTGETLSERDRLERSADILLFASTFPNGTVEDSGSNLARTRGFIKQASESAWTLKNRYINANNQSLNYESSYSVQRPDDMSDVKSNLQQALNYLNTATFETDQNHRASAIDFTTRAISQIDAYLINPPAAKKTRPTKTAPNGAKTAKPKGNSENNEQQMVNQNGVDKTLKTNPAGANDQPAKPAKTTKNKPKANSKTAKPTENLFPLDDPWGKSPKKRKQKVVTKATNLSVWFLRQKAVFSYNF